MRLIELNTKLSIEIDENLIARIGQLALKHYPNEFGGFLLGKYSDDRKTVFVNSTIQPKTYKGTKNTYERFAGDLVEEFDSEYKRNKNYFVGEWHSHPNGTVNFSSIDMKAIREMVDHDTVQLKNPLLLIVSIGKFDITGHQFYVYHDNTLKKFNKHDR